MTDFGSLPISGNNGVPVWRQGQGECLIYNLDPNNTIYIADDISVQPGSTNSAPLPPNSSIVADGKHDLFAQCLPGLTATLGRFPGGRNFFNLAEIITRTLIILATVGNGQFVYDLNNNLVMSVVGSDTHDPKQNILCHPGVTTFNGHGAAVNYLSTSLNAFFQYFDNQNSTQGSLILSVASRAGTDPYDNFGYPAGILGFNPVFGDSFIGLGSVIQLSELLITQRGSITVNGPGQGITNQPPFMVVDAPEQTTAQHGEVKLFGATPDGTTRPLGSISMGNVSGTNHLPIPSSQDLLELLGAIALQNVGATPAATAGFTKLFSAGGMLGSVTPQGLANLLQTASATSVNVNTVTSATFANLTSTAIPAKDADRIGATYKIKVSGYGTWGSTAQALTLGIRFGAAATNVIGTSIVFAAGTMAASTPFQWDAEILLTLVSNPQLTTATWRASIRATISPPGGGGGGTLAGGTGTAPTNDVTLDGTIVETLGLSAEWASVTGAPTISKSIAQVERTS